jgi:class 3 adenylate cyclase
MPESTPVTAAGQGSPRPPTEYSMDLDQEGNLVGVRGQPGDEPIPVDVNDQRYCDFLSATAHSGRDTEIKPYGRLPRRTHYFADRDRLVEHCKVVGQVIYTCPHHPGERHEIDTVNLLHWGDFFSLPVAEAPPDGDGRPTQDGVARAPSKTFVTGGLLGALQDELARGDENSPVRRLSTWPIDRAFVYADVSDFSRYPAGQQVLVINSIVSTVRDRLLWSTALASEARQNIETAICIGDGYIFVLKDPALATYFAAYLARLIEVLVARGETPVGFHFRMGVHCGPVYSFWDPGRKDWNYIGDGINGGQRVLGAVGKETDDVVFVSGQVRQRINAADRGDSPYPQILAALHNRGRKADKHGNPWRVYEVNHTGLTAGGFPASLREPPGG